MFENIWGLSILRKESIMLNLKNITKIYKTSSFEQKALDDVSISFRNNEFKDNKLQKYLNYYRWK